MRDGFLSKLVCEAEKVQRCEDVKKIICFRNTRQNSNPLRDTVNCHIKKQRVIYFLEEGNFAIQIIKFEPCSLHFFRCFERLAPGTLTGGAGRSLVIALRKTPAAPSTDGADSSPIARPIMAIMANTTTENVTMIEVSCLRSAAEIFADGR